MTHSAGGPDGEGDGDGARYTSALVNDANVSRDTNPFRPERMVRALWEGVQQLPMARPLMAAFLLASGLAMALAQYLLAKSYEVADAAYVQPFDGLKLPLIFLAGWLVLAVTGTRPTERP